MHAGFSIVYELKRYSYALVNFMPHPPPPGWGNTGDLTN